MRVQPGPGGGQGGGQGGGGDGDGGEFALTGLVREPPGSCGRVRSVAR